MVSAAIITYNEARNIERCLNSLIGVVDEIVVVDSFSTDATVEICRRYGAVVTSRSFDGYGSQRQYAAGLTHGRYVLSIDADEVLDEQLRNNIIALKKRGFDHRMYAFKVVHLICGHPMRGSGMKPDIQTRLFDKRYASWNLADVDERVTYPGSVNPCIIGGEMHHYRCNDLEELAYKELRNAELRGRTLAAAGINAPGPLCWFRAACAFLNCHTRQGALLDGATGNKVAMLRFRTTLAAYRSAHRIASKHKEGSGR